MAHEQGLERMSEYERTFRLYFFEMYAMTKSLSKERNSRLNGES